MNTIRRTLDTFTSRMYKVTDQQLDIPWAWNEYKGEGIRFAYFRIYEELRSAAARVSRSQSMVERILAQNNLAYWDLRATLLGLPDDLLDKTPAPNEWSPRQIIKHVAEVEWGFFGCLRFFLEKPEEFRRIPKEFFDDHYANYGNFRTDSFSGSLSSMLDFFEIVHYQVLTDLETMPEVYLADRCYYWEEEPQSIEFRLHRFHSHLRQHTIQMAKTLPVIGYQPNESCRLLGMIDQAYAELEGKYIGCPQFFPEVNLEPYTAVKDLL
ncbi:MAG TPA: DinB family protein [Longilinea sp.]|nr:DinB family protein [Longilinea sp.]